MNNSARSSAPLAVKGGVHQNPRSRQAANNSDKSTEITSTRDLALLETSVEHIQHMDTEQIMVLQRLLQHGETLGVWCTPANWLAASLQIGTTSLRVDLRKRILDYLPEDIQQEAFTNKPLIKRIDKAVLTLTRYLLLLRMGPVGMGGGAGQRSLDVSTISTLAYTEGPQLMALALTNEINLLNAAADTTLPYEHHDFGPKVLGTLAQADLSALSKSARRGIYDECKRMHRLQDMGLWWDVPTLELPSKTKIMTGLPVTNELPEPIDEHKPLPDDYVAQMGQRSIWILKELGPNIMAIASAMVELWDATHSATLAPESVANKRQDGVKDILARHQWKDSSGNSIERPPFTINLAKEPGFVKLRSKAEEAIETDEFIWPPRHYPDIKALLGTVQMAHYFIVALSMGARQSETLSLKRTCITYAVDKRPYANGRTFKLEQRYEGVVRDWQLPDIATEAVEQQVRLVRIGEQLSRITPSFSAMNARTTPPTHLWGQFSAPGHGDATKPLLDINQALTRYALTLGLSVRPGGQKFRSHRFRKTLARLVALALTQAPKILMEVFGHKTIEMTLHYILSDKSLRKEIEQVSRELRVMRAKEVVERMVEADIASLSIDPKNLAGYGGLGALGVRGAVNSYRETVFRRGDQWGAQSVWELSELLTLQGTAWEQVRHGVICTKFPGQAGPCNKSFGRPEPSKCKSSCGHRLEEAFLREDVDGAIRDALSAYEIDSAKGEKLSAAFWVGQLRAHVPRFPDLHEKWMKDATIQSLLAQNSASTFA